MRDHAADGVPGFVSMLGGKLASYRAMAEETTDLIARQLGNGEPCRTHLLPLPGGEASLGAVQVAAETGLPELAASRLIYRQGARALPILEAARGEAWLHEMVCPCEQVSYAEARYCLREEICETLSDLRRRCRVGMGQCQGLALRRAGGELAARRAGPHRGVGGGRAAALSELALSGAAASDGPRTPGSRAPSARW